MDVNHRLRVQPEFRAVTTGIDMDILNNLRTDSRDNPAVVERIAHRSPVEIDEVVTRRAPTDIERAEEIVWNADARQRHEPFERIAAGAWKAQQFTAPDLLTTDSGRHAFAFYNHFFKLIELAQVDFHLRRIARTHLDNGILLRAIGRMRDRKRVGAGSNLGEPKRSILGGGLVFVSFKQQHIGTR